MNADNISHPCKVGKFVLCLAKHDQRDGIRARIVHQSCLHYKFATLGHMGSIKRHDDSVYIDSSDDICSAFVLLGFQNSFQIPL